MPGIGGFFGTKLPPPAAMTTARAVISVSASVHDLEAAIGQALETLRHLTKVKGRVERLDLLQEAVGQFLSGDNGERRNVVNRLFRIELRALAARAIENVDEVRLEVEKPSSKTENRPTGPAPMMTTSVS